MKFFFFLFILWRFTCRVLPRGQQARPCFFVFFTVGQTSIYKNSLLSAEGDLLALVGQLLIVGANDDLQLLGVQLLNAVLLALGLNVSQGRLVLLVGLGLLGGGLLLLLLLLLGGGLLPEMHFCEKEKKKKKE